MLDQELLARACAAGIELWRPAQVDSVELVEGGLQTVHVHRNGRELLAEAKWVEGNVLWRRNLAYTSRTFATDGCVLVGDAAAFMDPFYSPGMDWISFTVSAAVGLIADQLRGEPAGPLVEKHNADFSRSVKRWFEAIYKDKYQYIGEYDLVRVAFLMDLGLYYLGIVSQPFLRGREALRRPPFADPVSTLFYHFMRTYNRRFARIAAARRKRGELGRTNNNQRFFFPGYTLARGDFGPMLKAMLQWGVLELRELLRR